MIASRVLAHPERGAGEIFRELQRRFPGRFELSHLRTLQRGVRKIRARLREPVQVQQQEDVVPAALLELASFESSECFYNREHRHATLHSLSPVAYEQQMQQSPSFDPPKKSEDPTFPEKISRENTGS